MNARARVYTRGGDDGTSQLLSVGRVPKSHPRLTAYGDIDELNSAIGVVLVHAPAPPLGAQLTELQHRLFVLGSQIAVPDPESAGFEIPSVTRADTDQLERWIDELDAGLPPLRQFILPGGTAAAAHLHLARTICRRGERNLQALHATEPLADTALTFINRFSDYLFTAARHDNQHHEAAEQPWRR